jgi:hypothetical protein
MVGILNPRNYLKREKSIRKTIVEQREPAVKNRVGCEYETEYETEFGHEFGTEYGQEFGNEFGSEFGPKFSLD